MRRVLTDPFWCCGGNDDKPPQHTQDCSAHPPPCYVCKTMTATQTIAIGEAYAMVCGACAVDRWRKR